MIYFLILILNIIFFTFSLVALRSAEKLLLQSQENVLVAQGLIDKLMKLLPESENHETP